MSKKGDQQKQQRIRQKAKERQRNRRKKAILRKAEFEGRRKQAIAVEIRQSQIKEIIKPTFNKAAWGRQTDQSGVAKKSVVSVLKPKKVGFDRSIWQPPVTNPVAEPTVQSAEEATTKTGFSKDRWKPRDAEDSSQ